MVTQIIPYRYSGVLTTEMLVRLSQHFKHQNINIRQIVLIPAEFGNPQDNRFRLEIRFENPFLSEEELFIFISDLGKTLAG